MICELENIKDALRSGHLYRGFFKVLSRVVEMVEKWLV